MNDIMALVMGNKRIYNLFEEVKEAVNNEDRIVAMEIVGKILNNSGNVLDTVEMYKLENTVTSFRKGELSQEDFLKILEDYQAQIIDKDFLDFLQEVEELVSDPILKGNEKAQKIGEFIESYKK